MTVFDRPKEKFYFTHAEDNSGNYACHTLVGAQTEHIVGRFPLDMSRILTFVIAFIPVNNTFDLTWTTSNGQLGEDKDTHTDAGSENGVAVVDRLSEVSVKDEFSAARSGDCLGISIVGKAGINQCIMGLILTYKGEVTPRR